MTRAVAHRLPPLSLPNSLCPPMHVWYINHYAGGPGIAPGYRAYHLAKAWQAEGHCVTIIAGAFHHLLEKPEQLPPEVVVNGVRYICLPVSRYHANGIARLRSMADFCAQLLRMPKRMEDLTIPKPDAIIVSSPHPFPIYPGYRLARRFAAKLVFEIRDLWPLSLTEILGTSRWHPFVKLCARTERYAYRYADIIASLLPRADHYISAIGMRPRRFLWVPNGAATHAAMNVEPLTATGRRALRHIHQQKAEGHTIVIHAGAMGPPNGLELLVEAGVRAKAAGCSDKLSFVLVGGGLCKEALQRSTREHGLQTFAFFDWVPKADVTALVRAADIGYAGVNSINGLYQYGVALNKIIDYLQAGCPVLLPLAPCGDAVSTSGAGIARRMETPDDVWKALRELADMTPQERKRLGALGRTYIEREYNYATIAKNYVDAMSE